jgi:hypothetical protein
MYRVNSRLAMRYDQMIISQWADKQVRECKNKGIGLERGNPAICESVTY